MQNNYITCTILLLLYDIILSIAVRINIAHYQNNIGKHHLDKQKS
jgi:hypothetical protein